MPVPPLLVAETPVSDSVPSQCTPVNDNVVMAPVTSIPVTVILTLFVVDWPPTKIPSIIILSPIAYPVPAALIATV